MKHICHPLATVIAVSICLQTSAQITLLSSDMAQIGDQVTRYLDTIPTYGPGGAGPNQTWDFSNAVIEDTAITDVVTVASTPYSSTFSGSDYAMTGELASYLYFTQTTGQMIVDGAAGDLLETGDLIEAPFTDPLLLHVFPRTYSSFFDDTYAFQAEADGTPFGVYLIRLTKTGHVYDTTDGYGTLITPTGTYDAIRVKTTDFSNSIVEAQLSPLFPVWTGVSNTLDTAVSYSWHAKLEKLAIAEYAYDTVGDPKQFVFSTVLPVVTGIADDRTGRGTNIYPQPANERICLQGFDYTSDSYTAEVYGIEGKKLWQRRLDRNCLAVDGLRSGFYLLRIRNDEGIYEETKRFVVQH